MAQKGVFSEFLMQHIQEMDDEEELEKIAEVIKETAGADVKNLLDRSISTIAEKV